MAERSTTEADEGTGRLAFWFGTVPGHVLAGLSCLFLFGMMILTFVDVTGRYVFNNPIYGAYEIIYLMMPALIFLAFPILCFREGHVTIDLLDGFVPRSIKRWQAVLVNVVSAVAVAFIGWRLYVLSGDQVIDLAVTDTLYLPKWPFSLFMAIMSWVATVALIFNVVGYLFFRREPPSTAAEIAIVESRDL
jgi:TRAP-type C4-dicarboxylate transport system permease small subunit